MIPLGVLAARRPAGGGAWSPADLGADLKAWWDASDTATIAASGSNVTALADKSGNGLTLVNSSLGSEPQTGTVTRNGLNVLDFGGNDELRRVTTGPSVAQPVTVAAVWRDVNGSARWYASNDNKLQYASNAGIYAGSAFLNGPSYTANTWAYSTHIYNGASSVARLNGTPGSTGNPGSNGLSGSFFLGARNGSSYITGQIAEFVIIAGAVSGATLASIEGYLADKWGF